MLRHCYYSDKLLVRRCLLAAALLLPAAARAQMPAMPVFTAHGRTYGLQLGRAAPTTTNGFNAVAAPGISLVAQHLRYPTDWIAAGAEVSIESMGDSSANNFSGLLRVNLLRDRSWTPYVLGGLGWHSAKLPAGSSGNLTVSGGAGIEFFIVQKMSVLLETRFRQYRLERAALGGLDAESLSVVIGVNIWRFN